jgi:hypothetical protein
MGILLVFLGLQLFLVFAYLMLGGESGGASGVINWTAGRSVFEFLQGMLLVTLMVLVPAYACIRLASERGDHNVDLLFISTLRPRNIILGKFFAALVLAVLVLSACAPFITFAYLMRGIDVPTILTILGIDLLCLLFGTMIALFLAAVPGGRVLKVIFCLIGFILLGILCVYLVFGTVTLIQFGARFSDSREFWEVSSVVTACVLGWVGLLFFYCVALVSPHSSNRMLAVRLYVTAVWLLSGAALFLLPRASAPGSFDMEVGLRIWITMFTFLLGLQFLVSLCERDHWGPRVARSIPRRWWLRAPAFLFYTGAGGGVLLSVLLLAGTLLVGVWWAEYHDTRAGSTWSMYSYLGVFLIGLLYLYCYGLSGVLARVYLLSGQVRSGYTWVIVLLLIGLGSSVPAMIAYVLFPEQIRTGTDGVWWKLPSPFVVVIECWPSGGSRVNDDLATATFWFLTGWAALASVVCLPWLIGQMIRFRPPRRAEVLVAEVAEPAAAPRLDEKVVREGAEAAEDVRVTRNGEAEPGPAPAEAAGSIQPG